VSEFEGQLKEIFERFEPLPQRCARNRRRLRVYLTLYVLVSSVFGCAALVIAFFTVLAFGALRGRDSDTIMWELAITLQMPAIIGAVWLVSLPLTAIWYWRAVRHPERELLGFLRAVPVEVGECASAKSALHDAVIAAGMPMPRLALISDTSLNAFVIARSAETAWVGVTSGLLGALSQDELRCAFAHLVSRVRDGSAMTATVMAQLFQAFANTGTWGEEGMDSAAWSSPEGGSQRSGLALLRWYVGASSLFVLAGYKRAQRIIAESADVEAMLLTRDPQAMLGALRTVLPADNRPGTIWDPRLREDVFGALFFAWPTFSFADDEELVRIRRMREVLGAAGA
jgi:Zn-dependent protease with chaperone function